MTHPRSGLTPKEAAARMILSRYTGHTYAKRAKRRVGARTNTQLVADICEKQTTP